MQIRFSKYDAMVPIADLKEHPKNRNIHPADQIERLAKLMRECGVHQPIHVSKRSGFICFGHGRRLAALKNGWAEFPVVYQDFASEEEEYACLIHDNSIASWAELDLSAINLDLPELGPDFDLELLGIKDFVLDMSEKGKCDEDEIPSTLPDPKVARGEIYLLGDHRLMCGDSTVITDIERLMNGEKADMCFTSPPYNLGDNAKLRGYNGNGKDSAYNTKSDHKNDLDYLNFLIEANKCALIGAHTVFWNIQLLAGNKFVLPDFWSAFKNNLIDLICWDKEHAQPSAARRVLNSVWEFIFVFSDEQFPKRSMKFGPDFRGTIDNIYRLNPVGKKDPLAKNHGATFPVQFAEFFISKFSDKSVLDLFGGSGSTLIACEKTARKCFMMEIDPHYCGVILDRWEKFSGKQAEREDGKSWADIRGPIDPKSS